MYCGPRQAWLVGGAIALASPRRFLTLTLVGEDWQRVRERMFHLRSDLKRATGGFDWVWSVEWNPTGTGHHVHAYQRGEFVAQRLLSSRARARGMGRVVDIRQWKGASPGYGVKLAGYGVKLAGESSSDALCRFLDVNGARLVHTSRSFWRDENGGPCGAREARRAFLRTVRDDVGDEWIAVFDRSLEVS